MFLLYSLLNTATISPAGPLEVPWTIKGQVNKDHCTTCSASLERARIMLWIGIKASDALSTCTEHSEIKEVGGGNRQSRWRPGSLPSALPLLALAGKSLYWWTSSAIRQEQESGPSLVRQDLAHQPKSLFSPFPHCHPSKVNLFT